MLGSDVRRMFRATQVDDWVGVRERARRVRRRTAAVEHLAGLAELVVGDVPTARRHFEAAVALAGSAAGQRRFVPASARQLVTVERMAGDLRAARARLAALPPPTSQLEAAYVAVQLALVELSAGDPDAARVALEADAVPRSSLSPTMRRSLAADESTALILLARARRQLGDLDGARAALDAAAAQLDDRPYVRAELLLEEGWVAETAGRGTEAQLRATGSVERFEQLGAAVDAARARLLVAQVVRDSGALDLAEATFRERGAFGHVPEVEAARSALEAG